MTRLGLWARITGKDKGLQFPVQQAASLSRAGDYTVILPYGLHADLPEDTLLRVIAPGIAIPVTTGRPEDTERGEPVFFHPATNTRIIARNNGDLDIEAGAKNVNINAAVTNLGEGGAKIGRLGDTVEVTIDAGTFLVSATGGVSNAEVIVTGTITGGGVNTSI